MSGLAGILAHHHDPGLYRWHAAFPADEVAHAVEHAGWQFGYVDGWHHQTGREVLTAIGEALGFPDYYGRNLDALNDCLGDLEGRTVLLWDGWGTLAREDGRTFGVIVELLGQCVGGDQEDGRWSATVATLLRGDGPDVDVPYLD
jgi:RNAse (barnase) inhibitor barstar